MRNYLSNLAVSISQMLNAVRGGDPDFTVSAHTYVEAVTGNAAAQKWMRRIDAVFFWEYSHCEKSWLRDVAHADEVKRVQSRIEGMK